MYHFYAVLSRMKYIARWGLMRNTRTENLSEHSLETAFLAHALALIGNRRLGKNYNADHIALLAMYHDATEIITGDLPTPIKYYNPQIKGAYQQIEAAAGEQLISMLPEDLQPDYRAIFSGAAPEEKKLVKAADKLSAYIKCLEEERMGNREFTVAARSTEKIIRELGIPEADIFMEEFAASYGLTLDEQA